MRVSIAAGLFCTLLISSAAQADFPATYTYDPYVRHANSYYEDSAAPAEPETFVPPIPTNQSSDHAYGDPIVGTPGCAHTYSVLGSMENPVAGGCTDGNGYASADSAPCADGQCDDGLWGLRGGWYGSVAGLVMTRDRPNRRVLTSDITDPTWRGLNNRDADVDWEGGFEVTFGRCLTENLRWEAGYWWLNQQQSSALVLDPTASLITTINLSSLTIGPDAATVFFDASAGHSLYREYDMQDVELNLYYRPCWFGGCGDVAYGPTGGYGDGCGSNPWHVELLAGVRYFRFEEFLQFGGVEGSANFGDLGGRWEAYIESEVENHLIGAQIGALIDYHLYECWTLYARPKIGLYGNHMSHQFNVRRGDNLEVGQNTVTGDWYPVASTKNDVSFLAEIDLGVRWDFSCNWSAFAAYRAIAVSGIALSDNQIPQALADIPGVRNIDSNASLIAHGVVAGLQFQF